MKTRIAFSMFFLLFLAFNQNILGETVYEFIRSIGTSDLLLPSGIAVNKEKVYVADTGHHCIQEFDKNGNFIRKWGVQGDGNGQFFDSPSDVEIDSLGNIYVADTKNSRIQIFNSNRDWLGKWLLFEHWWDRDYCGGISHQRQLFDAYRLALDSSNNIYASVLGVGGRCYYNAFGMLLQVTSDVYLRSCISFLNPPMQYKNKPIDNITIYSYPELTYVYYFSMAFDPNFSKIYVAIANKNIVMQFKWDWTFERKWGTSGSGDGQFNSPRGIAVDSAGLVYVSDTGNSRIQVFDSNGNFITKFGSPGSGDGQFLYPEDIEIDSSGLIYVADTGNNRIQVFGNGVKPQKINISLSKGWNGVSCPGDPLLSDWNAIIAGNPNIALVVEYDATQQAFMMASDIQFGKSYFIGVTGDTQIELEYYPRESLSVPAKGGWNSLGSTSCSIPAGNVTSAPSGQVSLIVYLDTNTGQFAMATTIDPGVGYMAGCLGDCTLSMNCTSPAPPIQRFVSKPTWESILSVQTESDHKEPIFGMNHSASDEIDLYDRPMPPLLDTKANITAGWIIENSCFDLFDRSYVKEDTDACWELSVELTEDGKISWDNLPEAYNFTLSYNDITVNMQTERLLSLPTGKHKLLISVGPKLIIPDKTSLLASYPNPCNPETWIPYELSEETEVKIMIYSSNGNLVRSLDLGHRPAGIYTDRSKAAYWDGRNESGEKVSSGIYFYTLVTPGFSRVRKLLIIR